MSTSFSAGLVFAREHLRTKTTLVMLVAIPVLFVVLTSGILSEFAAALGGSIKGTATSALTAGWSAAFLAGALGFFQVASSRDADRRLVLAGAGAMQVAAARVGASIVLGLTVTTVAYLTLVLKAGVGHPVHTFVAVLAFALIYIGIGTFIGSFISGLLEGSLAVAMVFVLDVFSGPGMSASDGIAQITPTNRAAEILIEAGSSQTTSTGDWLVLSATVLFALAVALASFWISARSRS